MRLAPSLNRSSALLSMALVVMFAFPDATVVFAASHDKKQAPPKSYGSTLRRPKKGDELKAKGEFCPYKKVRETKKKYAEYVRSQKPRVAVLSTALARLGSWISNLTSCRNCRKQQDPVKFIPPLSFEQWKDTVFLVDYPGCKGIQEGIRIKKQSILSNRAAPKMREALATLDALVKAHDRGILQAIEETDDFKARLEIAKLYIGSWEITDAWPVTTDKHETACHYMGCAVDLVVKTLEFPKNPAGLTKLHPRPQRYLEMLKLFKEMVIDGELCYVKNEYDYPSAGSNGPHFHLEAYLGC